MGLKNIIECICSNNALNSEIIPIECFSMSPMFVKVGEGKPLLQKTTKLPQNVSSTQA